MSTFRPYVNVTAYNTPKGEPHAVHAVLGSIQPLDDPYVPKHGLPTPVDDPWETVLKPELDADTARCSVWKEEVQNLLIFAGLFSAVVTAFIVESYKFLQPDPNDTIIGLLFHIANSLNNTAPFPPSIDPVSIVTPFSRTSRSVRLNILWLLSLILSLTTVLIGTISLQWLRQHQSYPNFSAKEKVAILHMRLQALDEWYVPHIFAGLPLLLQGALALFLIGMIDFSFPLGPKIVISVAIIVGFTLLFLGATTVLSSLQCIFLLLRDLIFIRKKTPAPCAFKSPQSQAFHILIGYFVTSIIHLIPHFIIRLPESVHPLTFALYSLWHHKSWREFDREWISLRDICHQSIYDKDPNLHGHQQSWKDEFPLSDVTQVLMKAATEASSAKHTEKFLAAVFHCFEELSKSVWTQSRTERDNFSLQRKDRRNNYFENLLTEIPNRLFVEFGIQHCSLSTWLIHGGAYEIQHVDSSTLGVYLDDETTLALHREQRLSFLKLLLETKFSVVLAQHYTELWMKTITQSHIPPLTPAHKPSLLPTFTTITIDGTFEHYSFVVGILEAVFESAAFHSSSNDKSLHALSTKTAMAELCDRLANSTYAYILALHLEDSVEDINAQYVSIFLFTSSKLCAEMSSSTSGTTLPSVLFYLASIFIWELIDRHRNTPWRRLNVDFQDAMLSLLQALLVYRSWISRRKNELLEERYMPQYVKFDASIPVEGRGQRDHIKRFSKKWWNVLRRFAHSAGLNINEINGQFLATQSGPGPLSVPSSPQGKNTISFPMSVYPTPPVDPNLNTDAPRGATSNGVASDTSLAYTRPLFNFASPITSADSSPTPSLHPDNNRGHHSTENRPSKLASSTANITKSLHQVATRRMGDQQVSEANENGGPHVTVDIQHPYGVREADTRRTTT